VKVPYIESKGHNIDLIAGDVKRIKSSLNNTKELDAMLEYLETKQKPVLRRRNDKARGCTITPNSTNAFNIPVSVLSNIIVGSSEKSIINIVHDRYSRVHPTQKPVRLLERLLALVGKEGDLILDPFAGSCSTAIACINTNRNYICCEIDEEYYSAAIKRVNKHKENKCVELF
jgi:site-specific DNA-methyltransferase (adenine-specific)